MSMFTVNDSQLPKADYEYVVTEDHARAALSYLDKYPEVAIDTEGTSLDPYEFKWSLLQIGVEDKAFVFDMRHDTEHSSVHPEIMDPFLRDPSKKKILQNAAFDMKVIKVQRGFYMQNVYDTMLAEQILNLGRVGVKANLAAITLRYLGLQMPKEPRDSFRDYYQTFQPFQLEYSANDVLSLHLLKFFQEEKIKRENLENVLRLESEFIVPLCEMELNGIKIDVDKWRLIMDEVAEDYRGLRKSIEKTLMSTNPQTTLFGVSLVNINSNLQLKKALKKLGLDLPDTQVGTLQKFKGIPVVDDILQYRKADKLLSTYAEPLLEKIHKTTGRLHTDFKQMVSTGRMSSSNPNLQNIPNKQKFRSCFIAEDGYSLLTADMSGAELRIIGNMSKDPVFVEAYHTGQDIHTRTASEMFEVAYDNVPTELRKAAKAINFGLAYGMSAMGLAARLGITKKKAENYIDRYFKGYKGVKKFLEESAKFAVRNKYSVTIAGRKRYYDLPPFEHPDRKRIQGSIERKGKNTPIQGSNGDTIKEAMILLVDRLKPYDARLLLTVHDELVVEAKDEQKYEVAKVLSQSLIDGFGKYFSLIPMETDTLVGPCWLKGSCENKGDTGHKCGCTEMKLVPDGKRITKLVCSKCGADQE